MPKCRLRVDSNERKLFRNAASCDVRSCQNARRAANTCHQDYVAVQDWVTRENAYQHALTVFNKSNSNNKKPAKDKPTPPPPAPTPAPSTCPAPTYYGIPSSALQPAAAGSS